MLRNLKVKFPIHAHPELIVGLNTADDAAVFKINDKQALIQTIDFFAPVVDDPYQYGAISAAMRSVISMRWAGTCFSR